LDQNGCVGGEADPSSALLFICEPTTGKRVEEGAFSAALFLNEEVTRAMEGPLFHTADNKEASFVCP